MSDAIIASEVGRKAAYWKSDVTFYGQCTWWSNILRMWSYPDTKSVVYTPNGSWVVNAMTWVWISWISSSLGSYSVNGIQWYGNKKDTSLRYCRVGKYDFSKYVPNMIFSYGGWSFWHTGYVVEVNGCEKESTCTFNTLESNTLDKWANGSSHAYQGWAKKWTAAYPYKFILAYYHKKWVGNKNTGYADLNRPYTQAMVQKLYGKVTQDSINKFCADYDNNIKQFK